MPFAKIDDTLEMFYEDDCFTDPWRGEPETIVLHPTTTIPDTYSTANRNGWPETLSHSSGR